jgi:hypothetical protein
MDPAVTSLLTIAGSGIAAYYGAYFKKRGEDQAMKEGFAEVLRQTTETTKATKAIEAKISEEVWDRQKQWELKREVLFDTARRMSTAWDILKNLENHLQTGIKNPAGKTAPWVQLGIDENTKWFRAMAALHESRLFITVTCGKEVLGAINKYVHLITMVAAKIHQGDPTIFKSSWAQLDTLHDAVSASIRKELGVDESLMSQSSESLAAPSPAPPNPATK